MAAAKELATLIRGRIMRTNARHRPFPTAFHFPGLNTGPWWSTAQVPWAAKLEENTVLIREEYDALVASKAPSDYHLHTDEHKLHSGSWDWHSYISSGKRQPEFERHCPTTASLLNNIPGLMTDIPFAYSFFSTLAPGSAIAPHHGATNLKVRCHLTLHSPQQDSQQCALRVADEARAWKPGQLIMFDDSFEHEVWYKAGDGNRVVLLFDVWHPDLTAGEVRAATALLGELAASAPEGSR